jgi:hypothetical protein
MQVVRHKSIAANWTPELALGGLLALMCASGAAAQSPMFPTVQPLPNRAGFNEPWPSAARLELRPLPPQYAQPLPPRRVFGVGRYGAWNTYGFGSSPYTRVYGGAGSNLPPPEVLSTAPPGFIITPPPGAIIRRTP